MIRFIVLLLALVLYSCNRGEESGSGDFIIVNNSSKTVQVETQKVPQLSDEIDTTVAISPHSSLLIFSDAIIGVNITPTTTYTKMKILLPDTDSLKSVYTQDPIDESKWEIEKQYSKEYGHTVNRFTFTDNLISE